MLRGSKKTLDHGKPQTNSERY
uniref:Uncharacterized protein n=1 Tax=Anguilla anguilla TaxID=7936 RepID=A0A0E9Q0N1_ANGAN